MNEITRLATVGTMPNTMKKASPSPMPAHIHSRDGSESSRAPAGLLRRSSLAFGGGVRPTASSSALPGRAPGATVRRPREAPAKGGAPSLTLEAPPFLAKLYYFFQLFSMS